MSDLIGAMWEADADPEAKTKGWSRNLIIEESGLARQAGFDAFALREFYDRVVGVLRSAEVPVHAAETPGPQCPPDTQGRVVTVRRHRNRVWIEVTATPAHTEQRQIRPEPWQQELALRAATALEAQEITLDFVRAAFLEECASPVADAR